MKRSSYLLKIESPCSENWASMTLTNSGRFCAACAKNVTDFTGLSDDQVLAILKKSSGNLCGRLQESQVNRYLLSKSEPSNKSGFYKLFAGLFLLTATNRSLAKSGIDKKPKIEQGLESFSELRGSRKINPKQNSADSLGAMFRGRVIYSLDRSPLPGATITLKDSDVQTVTDRDGEFELTIPSNSVYRWYQPWVASVRHRTDLNYIVDILGGEVAVGHSFTSGGDLPKVDNVPIGLLGADVIADGNRYRLTKIFSGENWNPGLKSPLSGPGIDVRESDYVLEVNGRPVTTAENFFSYFEGLADRQIKLRVNQKADTSGSRLVTVVPITNEAQLRLRGWVEGNRRKVSELSGGKLTYVWLPNTANGGYEYFNRYYFAQQDKKGAIIDERNNGGGSAADYIVDVLGRKLQGYFNSNAGDHRPFTTPIAGLWGPKVMIINERAGSGGDLMPYLFRQAKVGPLVGTRTWGGLVGTWDTPRFIDGGRMVAPRGGFYDLNGNWAVEGEGIAPDIEVMQNPADVIASRDPQLIKAVEEAMRLLKTEEVVLKPEPSAPNKYRRPEGRK